MADDRRSTRNQSSFQFLLISSMGVDVLEQQPSAN
jgi:hypothetical protein